MKASLTITDVTGRVVKVYEGVYPKGLTQVQVRDVESKGLLYYQLLTEDGLLVKKMIQVE